MSSTRIGIITIALLSAVLPLFAQNVSGINADGNRQNNIITAVPFMMIMPQARAGAMGNAGVALDADASASAMNVSALAFLPEKASGVSLSYSPWLKSIAPDISLAYISGYYRLNEQNTIGAAFRYFTMGQVQLTDANFQSLGVFSPSELAFDVSYSRSFGPDFAMGGTVRYIHSGLYNDQVSDRQVKPGEALAVDVSGLYKRDITLFGKATVWSMGLNLSNIGTKISYSDGAMPYFLPANFKIGTGANIAIDGESNLCFALDLNKLMAPTQPVYDQDGKIVKGQDPNRSEPAGIFGSFADAPGGFGEEIKEVGISTGIEYSYQQKFALRAGYNYQSPEKGNSRYLTLGLGLNYHIFNIDFAYIAANIQNSPLANTLRFTLGVNLKNKMSQSDKH